MNLFGAVMKFFVWIAEMEGYWQLQFGVIDCKQFDLKRGLSFKIWNLSKIAGTVDGLGLNLDPTWTTSPSSRRWLLPSSRISSSFLAFCFSFSFLFVLVLNRCNNNHFFASLPKPFWNWNARAQFLRYKMPSEYLCHRLLFTVAWIGKCACVMRRTWSCVDTHSIFFSWIFRSAECHLESHRHSFDRQSR